MAFRAVIFDIGGVLFQYKKPAKFSWESIGLMEQEMVLLFRNNSVFQQALVGKVTREEAYAAVWAEMQKRLSLPDDRLQELVASSRLGEWDDELLAFIRTLRPTYKTGVISDAWLDTREQIRPWANDDLFDAIVISAEEGVAKPDAEIYRRALSRLGVAAEEAIFVDDWPPNVEGARALGIHAIQFTDSAQVRAEIERLLGLEKG